MRLGCGWGKEGDGGAKAMEWRGWDVPMNADLWCSTDHSSMWKGMPV